MCFFIKGNVALSLKYFAVALFCIHHSHRKINLRYLVAVAYSELSQTFLHADGAKFKNVLW